MGTFQFALALAYGTSDFPISHRKCKLATDCVIAYGSGCVGPEAVNKTHLKDYDEWAAQRNSEIDCALNYALEMKKTHFSTKCIDGICNLVKPDDLINKSVKSGGSVLHLPCGPSNIDCKPGTRAHCDLDSKTWKCITKAAK